MNSLFTFIEGLDLSEAIAAGDCALATEIFATIDAELSNLLLPNGMTPLIWAVYNQKVAMAKEILHRGDKVNRPASIQPGLVSPLLMNLFNSQHDKVYAIQLAVYTQNVEMIELLLEHGALVNKCDCGVKGLLLMAGK